MRHLHRNVLAGVAAIALLGVTGLTLAQINKARVLDVRLPDGSHAHIRYIGDTPPTVSFAPAPSALSILAPASDPLGSDGPFAALERISAAMDRQAETLLREAPSPAITGPDEIKVDLGKLPPGTQGFSMVSTVSGSGVCTRSVEYRSLGEGKAPQVVTRTSGACTADQSRPASSAKSASSAETSQPQPKSRQPV
jgi:hypothetical protein